MSALARFIAASGLTNLGDGVAMIAWAWVASLLTRDPLLIALVPAMLKLPWALFVLPAGVLTDRHDRLRLILGADGFRALAYAGAAVVILAALPLAPPLPRGLAQPGLFAGLLGLALLIGAAEVLRDNTAQTIVPALVPESGLERANGRLWSVEMTANALVGPALAGALLALSPAAPFAVNAAAMAAAVAILAFLPGRFRPHRPHPRHWVQELAEGWRVLVATPLLRNFAILTGLWNFGFEAMMIALVLLVQERLGLGPWAMSVILGAGAVGGILAGLLADRIVARLGKGRTMQLSLVFSMAFPLAGMSDSLALIAAGFLISEFWGITWNTVSVATRQRLVPSALLGRLNATYRLFALGMIPLGMVGSGLAVRAAEPLLGRGMALLVPFALALALYGAMAAGWWRWLGRAFTR